MSQAIIVPDAGNGRRMEVIRHTKGVKHWHTHQDHIERLFVLTGHVQVEWITKSGGVRQYELRSGDLLSIENDYSHRLTVLRDSSVAHSYHPTGG